FASLVQRRVNSHFHISGGKSGAFAWQSAGRPSSGRPLRGSGRRAHSRAARATSTRTARSPLESSIFSDKECRCRDAVREKRFASGRPARSKPSPSYYLRNPCKEPRDSERLPDRPKSSSMPCILSRRKRTLLLSHTLLPGRAESRLHPAAVEPPPYSL